MALTYASRKLAGTLSPRERAPMNLFLSLKILKIVNEQNLCGAIVLSDLLDIF